VLDAVVDIARELDVSPAQVAVAWVLHPASAARSVPIICPRDLAQLDDYLAALKLVLTGDQLARLDQVSAPDLGVPHVGTAKNVGGILGGNAALVDQPLVPVL
jgi:aryl-alcohol dehydrogenase-like predicted oxidoreductase